MQTGLPNDWLRAFGGKAEVSIDFDGADVAFGDVGTAGVLVVLADLKIRTKTEELISLGENLKPVQSQFIDDIGYVPGKRLKLCREHILKGRQQGLSTIILALYFLDTINNPRVYSVVIAHDAESAERMFQMIRRFWENLPAGKKPSLKPVGDGPKGRANTREFYWPGIDSSFFVGQAGTKDFGRSSTINNAHCSEVASWADGASLVAGLGQAVPQGGNIFYESTAKGFGNWFEEEYHRIERRESVCKSRFYAWFDDPDYQTEPKEDLVLKPDELETQRRYSLTLAQMQWWHDKGLELGKKREQEYPCSPNEAFLVSGTPYFDTALLDRLLKDVRMPIYRADFEHHKPGIHEAFARDIKEFGDRPGKLLSYESDLEVWKLPQDGECYVIGADPAEGLNPKGDPDNCSASVLRRRDGLQVAHLEGCWGTHDFGMMLVSLARFYNDALLCIERNNHGHAVINSAVNMGGYPHQVGREPSGVYVHVQYDQRDYQKELSKKPGFPTTAESKTLALDALKTGVEQDLTRKIQSPKTLRQMIRFVELPGGKYGGEANSHDDSVMSEAMASWMLLQTDVQVYGPPKTATKFRIGKPKEPDEDAEPDEILGDALLARPDHKKARRLLRRR